MRIRYLSQMNLVKLDGKQWVLTMTFGFSVNLKVVTVPKGFKTDLATVPFPLSVFLPPDGDYAESACIHDYLLKLMYDGDESITRRYASSVFLASLKHQMIHPIKIAILYGGVKAYDLFKYAQSKFR